MGTEKLWYSELSTGILEVDNQHSNIDVLLTLFNNDNESLDMASVIVKTIKAHFRSEESLLGSSFPKDHTTAHNEFIEFNNYQLKKLKDNKNHFVSIIRVKLVEHTTVFDSKLKGYL